MTRPIGARIPIHGDHGDRRLTIDGQSVPHIDSVRIDETGDTLQRVTVTFLANQATVEPWVPDTTGETAAPHVNPLQASG